jgi:predicted HTH domain antitoxin
MKVKTIRLREDKIEEIEKIAKEEGKQVSEVLREIVDRGLKEYKIERAIERYQRGLLSQGAAAEEAGLTIQEFHQELKKRGFTLRIDLELIKEELNDL